MIEDLYKASNPKTKKWEPLVSKELLEVVRANSHVSYVFQFMGNINPNMLFLGVNSKGSGMKIDLIRVEC